jgi:hypothetical protein
VVRHHLRQQGWGPETAEIAAVLANSQWTTGDTKRTKPHLLHSEAGAQSGPLEALAEVVDRVDRTALKLSGLMRLTKCIAFWKEVETTS